MIKDLNNLPQLFQGDYFLYSGEITYRPLVTFSFFLDYAMFGLNPWGYHLTNILLHAANGALLYTFLTIVIKQPITSSKLPTIIGRSSVFDYRAFVISILFAVHPILTETVNSISFREELLTFLFYIFTFVLYLKLRASLYVGAPLLFAIYLLSCLTYFLALLSKEMAITLPLIFSCYEWIYRKKGQGIGIVIFNPYNVGYIAITLIYAYLRFYYYPGPEEDIPAFGSGIKSLILKISPQHYYFGGSLETTTYTMLRVVAYYIKLLVFPINLCGDYYQYRLSYSFDINVFLSTALVITLLAAGLLAKKIDRLITFGMVFFLVTLLPVLNIIPIKTLIAERFLYLPSLGFILSFAAAITSVNIEYRRLIWIMLSVSIIFFSMQTYKRNLVWKNQYSFWSDVVSKMPENSRAHYNLALSTPDLEEKIKELRAALYFNPTKDKTRAELAGAYFLKGKYSLAIELYTDILKRYPYDETTLNKLAEAYSAKGDLEKAREVLRKLNKATP